MLHQLGSGVLGPVFRAHDPDHDRLLAIKTFTLDLIPEDASRLAEALGRLVQRGPDHPALAGFVQAGLEGSTPYLATTFAAGETLDVALRGRGPMAPAEALAVLAPVADALDTAWARGIGHLALHPRDIFVTSDLRLVTLTGLGVAGALAEAGVSRAPRRPYAAPECVAGEAGDARADIFGLAAIAHEMLTGRRPGAAGVSDDAPFASGVPAVDEAALRAALTAALSAQPSDRPASAAAFVDALREAIAPGQPALPLAAADAVAPFPAGTPAPPAGPDEIGARDPFDGFESEDDASDRLRPPPPHARTFGDSLPPSPPPPARGWWRIAAVLLVGLAIGLAGVASFLSDRDQMTDVMVDAGSDTEVDLARDPPVATGAPPVVAGDPPVVAEAPPIVAEATPEPEAPAAGPAPDPPARRVAAPSGQLLVRSEPSGAIVLIDGQLRGETPATIRDLSLGAHAVQVARPGYAPETREVTLTPDAPSRNLTVALQAGIDPTSRLPGSVYADSRPRGARVLVDGRLVGTTPMRLPDLTAGRRTVRIEMDGYRAVTTTVTVTGGRESRVAVTLEPTTARSGGR